MALGYKWKLISRNQEYQWKLYDDLWRRQKVVPQSLWLDLPGNHDYSVDMNGIDHHTSQGCSSRVRIHSVVKEEETLCLMGIDFSYSPHVPYWLNLYGYGTKTILSSIRSAFASLSYPFVLLTTKVSSHHRLQSLSTGSSQYSRCFIDSQASRCLARSQRSSSWCQSSLSC